LTSATAVFEASLPSAVSDRCVRSWARDGVNASGAHSWAPTGKSNPTGPMPTIVYGSPSSRICAPMTRRSPPKCCFHKPSPMTTTRSCPTRSSPGSNDRPIAGERSSSKNPGDTRNACKRLGTTPRSDRIALQPSHATRRCTVFASRRQSRKFAGDTICRSGVARGESQTIRRRSCSGNWNGRSTIASIIPSTVAFSPTPSASVSATANEKPGCFRIARTACFTSSNQLAIQTRTLMLPPYC
jgi:hypothetical protein